MKAVSVCLFTATTLSTSSQDVKLFSIPFQAIQIQPFGSEPLPSRLRALGIIIDADRNLQGHWDSICSHLTQAGYQNLPAQPEIDGFITTPADKPRVGIWLMPNNQLPGMLENFVAHLIPDGDPLAAKAEAILQEIERDDLNRYTILHRPKAYIHTWLAWQETPGQPMGQAIMARVLAHDSPLATTFVTWLNHLFVSP